MKKRRCDGQETRQKLLAAAAEIFASKGFREATIANICQQAVVNTAAVSYHFGSKESLYVESWLYAFAQSLSIYPPDGGIPDHAPVEERLHGRILAIMRRVIDPQSHDFEIFYKEMASPTGLLIKAMQESVEPIFKALTLLVCELLNKQPHAQEVQLCVMSIRAQCFGPLLHVRRRKRVQDFPAGLVLLLEDVEQLADHVTRFSLAGIYAFRQQNLQ